mgnify:CR=1 FL=1
MTTPGVSAGDSSPTIQCLRSDLAARSAEPLDASTESPQSRFESLVDAQTPQSATRPGSGRRCTPKTADAEPAAAPVAAESTDGWGARLLAALRADGVEQRSEGTDCAVLVDDDHPAAAVPGGSPPLIAYAVVALPLRDACVTPASNTPAQGLAATTLQGSEAAPLASQLAASRGVCQSASADEILPDALQVTASAAEPADAQGWPSAMPSLANTAVPTLASAATGDAAWLTGAVVSMPTAAPAVVTPPPVIPSNSAASPLPLAELPLRLGDQLQWLLKNELQEVRLQLHPRELGHVTVQIRIEGQAAQVSFTAEHPAARAALEHALPMLRERFASDGLQLQQVTVGGGQGRAAGDGDSQTPARSPGGFPQQAGEPSTETLQPSHNVAPLRASRGLVDHYA